LLSESHSAGAAELATHKAAAGGAGWIALALALVLAVFLVDRMNGGEVSLSPFYLIAVTLAAWKSGRVGGLLVAGTAAVSWLAAYLLDRPYFSNSTVLAWNVAVELTIFVLAAIIISALRDGLAGERRLAASLERAYRQLDREIEVVGTIQRRLLPAEPPRDASWEIALDYATSQRAGGDYYDFFPLLDGRLAVWIADASGHGTPAAVLMAMIRVLVHSRPLAQESPGESLGALDRELQRHVLSGDFATACCAMIDPVRGTLELALAGHNPPLLMRANGGVEWLTTRDGPPLGLGVAHGFTTRRLEVSPGDTLAFYTDGCTETMNPAQEMLGDERFAALLIANARLEPAALRDAVIAGLEEFRGSAPLSDDRTFVVVRLRDPARG
jgi:serine phosphatase RsbU (regulator of sigma subunit)